MTATTERSAAFWHLLDAEAYAERGETDAALQKVVDALSELTADAELHRLAERVLKAAECLGERGL